MSGPPQEEEARILTLDDLLAREDNKSTTSSGVSSLYGNYQFPSQFSETSTSTPTPKSPDPVPTPPTPISKTLYKIVRASETSIMNLTTGQNDLDRFLNGGIAMTGITEISGESGMGKTQFALQLSLHALRANILGGLGSPTLYICTEQLFPSKRLIQLAHERNFSKQAPDKIYVEHVADTESLLKLLEYKVPAFLEKLKCKLIVIDTIAALFRADYTIKEMDARTKDLRKIGMILHSLSGKYDLGVIVVNQVSGCLRTNSNIPSLGLVWSNMVTNRLVLSRVAYGSSRRLLTVEFSPYIAPGKIDLILDNSGFLVFDVEKNKAIY